MQLDALDRLKQQGGISDPNEYTRAQVAILGGSYDPLRPGQKGDPLAAAKFGLSTDRLAFQQGAANAATGRRAATATVMKAKAILAAIDADPSQKWGPNGQPSPKYLEAQAGVEAAFNALIEANNVEDSAGAAIVQPLQTTGEQQSYPPSPGMSGGQLPNMPNAGQAGPAGGAGTIAGPAGVMQVGAAGGAGGAMGGAPGGPPMGANGMGRSTPRSVLKSYVREAKGDAQLARRNLMAAGYNADAVIEGQ